ncbi:MAG: type II toxin-antitoxin system antitoxin, RelB/DinJ family [Patescibacteria group bacterium]
MKTLLNVKVDKIIKDEAKKLAYELGLPLSTVVNGYLRQFIRDREIEFSAPLKPTPYLKRIINQAEKDWQEGKNYLGPFNTAKDMIDSLEGR